MSKVNENIRRTARMYGIPHWKICKQLGISEPTLTRWLREPLQKDREERIIKIIAALKDGEQND